MKVLHINSYYNGSIFYRNLFDQQQKTGTKLAVFVPVSSAYKNNAIDLGDYTKVSINHKKNDRIFFYLKHNKIFKDIQAQYKVNDFSIIHAHSLFSNGYIALRLKKKYGIPYIVAVRNTDLNIFFKKMPHLRKLGIEIMRNSDKVVFLSSTYQEVVLSKYIPRKFKEEIHDKLVIIPNGIDKYWFENLSLCKKLNNPHRLNILYVGAINRNKNLLMSIEAIKLLQKKGYQITYTVVGEIQDPKIFNKINKLNFVKYYSRKNKEELRDIYNRNDIFLMPSLTETFGLVYVEAMTQGLPVIYTRNQGFDKQFEDGVVGYSVDSKNPEHIANRIEEVLKDYEKISRMSIEKSQLFKWNIIEEKYRLLYKSVL